MRRSRAPVRLFESVAGKLDDLELVYGGVRTQRAASSGDVYLAAVLDSVARIFEGRIRDFAGSILVEDEECRGGTRRGNVAHRYVGDEGCTLLFVYEGEKRFEEMVAGVLAEAVGRLRCFLGGRG